MKDDKQVLDLVMKILHERKLSDDDFKKIYDLVNYAYNMGYMKGHMDQMDNEIQVLRGGHHE